MRYIRQIIFENIGPKKQKLISKSTVAIVGIGALGTVTAELLVRAGIGKLILIDRDFVELSNLQRQSLFDESDINKMKAEVALNKLKKINRYLRADAKVIDLDYENINVLTKVDLVLDCTDNFDTRFLINDHCKQNNIPWIFTSVIGSQGTTFNILQKGPCFACVFKEPNVLLGTCDTVGILNTIPHALASIQVTEALKILTKQNPSKDLIFYDIWKNKLTKTKISKNPKCFTCNKKYIYLDKPTHTNIKLCGTNTFQIKGKKLNLLELERELKKQDKVISTPHCIFFKELIIFKDGRVLVKAKTKERAHTLYNKYLE